MIQSGWSTTAPTTGTRMKAIQLDRSDDGVDFVLEFNCPVGAGPFALEHIHATWIEEFEILQGQAAYTIDGQSGKASAGDTVIMPAMKKHVHPWNTGDEDLVYRQIGRFPQPDGAAPREVFGAFATMFGLARAGKLNGKGLPKNPLQFGATLRTLVRHGGFDASVPIPVQKVIAATLGRLAESFGYRSSYPEYLNE